MKFATSLLIVTAIFLSQPSNAGSSFGLTTEVGNGADSYVLSTSASTNYGSEDKVTIKHDRVGGNLHRKGYVRFDLTTVPACYTDVDLSLTYTRQSGPSATITTFNVFGLNDAHAAEAWDETQINWSNAPANDTSSGDGVQGAEASFLGTFALDITVVSIGDSVTFDADSLLSLVRADTNAQVTLIITRQDRSIATESFASKENVTGAPPTLIFHFDPDPDSDGDGLDNLADNCCFVFNAAQRDSDNDGIGNFCDPDLDESCTVNFADLQLMKSVFFTNDADADLDGSGLVNFADLEIMKRQFFMPPGPSGTPNLCNGS